MNRIVLLSGLLVAGMSVASVSAECQNGGFAVGVKAGVNFTRAKVGQDKHRSSLKKTFIPVELFCGYAARINDVMLGLDVGFGTNIGKLRPKKGSKDSGGMPIKFTVKNPWYIDVLPRIGYLITPETEIYATAGARFGKYKVSGIYIEKGAKKTKVSGLFGAGARYTFSGGFFLGGEYLFQTPTKLKFKNVDGTLKVKSHTIQLVLGMSF